MATEFSFEIDPIEELKLRCWARANYVPQQQRANSWHPVVLDEMARKDRDLAEIVSFASIA